MSIGNRPKEVDKKRSKTYNYKSKVVDIRKNIGALDES
jgi:hypothetical protein